MAWFRRWVAALAIGWFAVAWANAEIVFQTTFENGLADEKSGVEAKAFGTPVVGIGKHGNGIAFDQTAGMLYELPNIGRISSPLTVGGWIHPSVSQSRTFFIELGDGGTIRKIGLQDGKVLLTDWISEEILSVTAIPTDEWTHVAATVTPDEIRLYVNGKFDSARKVERVLFQTFHVTDPFTGFRIGGLRFRERGMFLEIRGGNQNFEISRLQLVTEPERIPSQPFRGFVDDVFVSDAALGETEILRLMNGLNVQPTPVEAHGKTAASWGELKRVR